MTEDTTDPELQRTCETSLTGHHWGHADDDGVSQCILCGAIEQSGSPREPDLQRIVEAMAPEEVGNAMNDGLNGIAWRLTGDEVLITDHADCHGFITGDWIAVSVDRLDDFVTFAAAMRDTVRDHALITRAHPRTDTSGHAKPEIPHN